MDMSKFDKYDSTDHITDEEYAIGFIRIHSEQTEGDYLSTPEYVDKVWEIIKRASERHGFPITPALMDAYAETRAEVETFAHIAIPACAAAAAVVEAHFKDRKEAYLNAYNDAIEKNLSVENAETIANDAANAVSIAYGNSEYEAYNKALAKARAEAAEAESKDGNRNKYDINARLEPQVQVAETGAKYE